MPKKVVSYQYAVGDNPYISDTNQSLSINGTFNAPPDLDQTGITAILSAVGAVEKVEDAVCSDSALGTPRKLQFIRKSGNTMSIGVASRANLIAAATAIKGVLDPLNSGSNPVVCIKLFGEEFLNLNDEFSLNYDGTVFAPSHKAPATADKQNYASGVISYQADAANPIGTTVIHSIRSITEKATNEFSAQLGTAAAGCIGSFLTIANCGNGRSNPRKHRRFILDFSTKADPLDTAEVAQSENISVPVAGQSSTDINSCGTALAALPGLYCIGYMGESHSRFHKFL